MRAMPAGVDRRADVVQDQARDRRPRQRRQAPCRSGRPSMCRTSARSSHRGGRAASPCRRRRSAARSPPDRRDDRIRRGRRRRGRRRASRPPSLAPACRSRGPGATRRARRRGRGRSRRRRAPTASRPCGAGRGRRGTGRGEAVGSRHARRHFIWIVPLTVAVTSALPGSTDSASAGLAAAGLHAHHRHRAGLRLAGRDLDLAHRVAAVAEQLRVARRLGAKRARSPRRRHRPRRAGSPRARVGRRRARSSSS